MTASHRKLVILMADDDEEDRMLTANAIASANVTNELRFVEDGQELLDYLRREGDYTDPADSPVPGVILLDLNMPRVDGREALAQIKADPKLRRIPVVALTTSHAEQDILAIYDLGVSGYVVKPVEFDGLVEVMRSIGEYWLRVVRLPPGVESERVTRVGRGAHRRRRRAGLGADRRQAARGGGVERRHRGPERGGAAGVRRSSRRLGAA